MSKNLCVIACCLSLSMSSYGHGGRTDGTGGHRDKNSGRYHCHSEPCFSQHKEVAVATNEAIQDGRSVSLLYRRADWRHWSDHDRDCINTRHEILEAQSSMPVTRSRNGCSVKTGVWHDRYSGKTLTLASDLDIDHIVPLKWASDHGGAGWPMDMKERFANDAENLLAVDDGLNQEKGAKGPSKWLPPNQAYRCEYLARWQKILIKYPSLKMTNNENRIYRRLLTACH